MSEYDQSFDLNILIGHCLYLDTELVYFRTSFRLWVSMTRPLTSMSMTRPLTCDLISCFSDFALHLDT